MAILSADKRDVQVNGDFKTSGFKIQASAKAFEILSSNIYTNKVRAVVREYSCNAYDAHVAAGNPEPFKVHLPTHLEPVFSVRDYGTGLCDEDVRSIFTTYFQSTKTHSNDFVGALGLGSKSAFSIVESFLVTSYYNGKQSTYSCYKDEYGEPQIALLTTCDTNEPNGMEVSMNVSDREYEFEEEAVNVYQYFDQLPIINDQDVVRKVNQAKNDYTFVNERMSLKGNWGSLYALMGNVAYHIPNEYADSLSGFIRFEIGDLSFNAGREELSMDDSTKAKLKEVISEINSELAQTVYDNLDATTCAWQRAKMYANLSGKVRASIRKSSLNFDKFELPVLDEDADRVTIYSRGSWGREATDVTQSRTLPLHSDYRLIYCINKPRMKTRILSWMKHQRSVRLVCLTQKQADLFGVPAVVLEDIESVVPELERSTKASSPTRTKVSVWNGKSAGWRVKASECWDDVEIDKDNVRRVYVEISRYEPANDRFNMGSFKDINDSLEHVGHDKIEFYGLKTAYLKTKMFRDANWISLEDYLKEVVDNLPTLVIVKEPSRSWSYSTLFKKLADKVSDSRLTEYGELLVKVKEQHSDRFAYDKLGAHSKLIKKDLLGELDKEIVECYPVIKLLNHCGEYADTDQVEILANHIEEKVNVAS